VAEVRRKFFTEIPRSRVMLTSQHWLSLRSRQGSPTTQRPPLYPRQYHLNEHHESRCERCSTVDPAKILLNCLTSCLRTSARLAPANVSWSSAGQDCHTAPFRSDRRGVHCNRRTVKPRHRATSVVRPGLTAANCRSSTVAYFASLVEGRLGSTGG
jgi:hypothetical protein